jgi:uncharacterized ferredoxin-like protein
MEEGIKLVAELMRISARSAPKTRGEDYLDIVSCSQAKIKVIGRAMIDFGEKQAKEKYIRDGNSLLKSQGLVLLGLKPHPPAGSNCGACGRDCSNFPEGSNCAFRLLDLGIAIGSAVKTASLHNVDNRIMYRIGRIAKELKIMEANVVIGIPLAATGKSIYFDR